MAAKYYLVNNDMRAESTILSNSQRDSKKAKDQSDEVIAAKLSQIDLQEQSVTKKQGLMRVQPSQ